MEISAALQTKLTLGTDGLRICAIDRYSRSVLTQISRTLLETLDISARVSPSSILCLTRNFHNCFKSARSTRDNNYFYLFFFFFKEVEKAVALNLPLLKVLRIVSAVNLVSPVIHPCDHFVPVIVNVLMIPASCLSLSL